MRRFVVTIAAATVFVAGAPLLGASVGAAPIVAPGAIRAAADTLNVIESVQFIWLGHNYCWYDDGWNGPGWYWCGYGANVGTGWGGGYGWHHWRGGHPGGGARHVGGGRVRRGGVVGGGVRHVGVGGGGARRVGIVGGGARYGGGGGAMRVGGGGGMRGGGGGGGGAMHVGGGGGMRGGGGGGGRGSGGGHRSDIRLKEDIVPLARLDNGIELYRFRYKGSDHTSYVGVMAQEVRESSLTSAKAVFPSRRSSSAMSGLALSGKYRSWAAH
jgi:Chaperone of endosialidase